MARMIVSKVLEQMTGRRRLIFGAAFAVPVVLVGALAVRGRDPAPALSAEHAVQSVADPLSVRLTRPQVRTIVRVVGQPSFVEAYERTSVFPKMTAYIEKWNVDIGDKVKRGDVLASLYVPELREDWQTKKETVKLDEERVELKKRIVEVAKADVEAAAARLKEAKEILDQYKAQVARWDSEVVRLKREVKGGVVDPQVLLESENQLRSTKAAEAAARATIEKAAAELLSKKAAKLQADVDVRVASADLKVAESEAKRLEALVGYLVLPAPFDGIVHVRNANTGDFVLPANGDPTAMPHGPHTSLNGTAAPVYVVDRIDIVRIFVDIPEHDANFVQKGTKAKVQIRGFRDRWLPATVERTAWALNVKSRTLRAEIDLPNTDAKILPGMYAYAKVIIERPNTWAVPVAALTTLGDSTYYWTTKKDRDGKERAVRVEVQTGASDGTWIEVTNRQHEGSGEDSWTPIDGSERVVLADDLGLLTQGDVVHLSSGTDNGQLATATNAGEAR
jgi:HlyD family secretion protein